MLLLTNRCSDVLELVETTRQFGMLADVAEIGGASNAGQDLVIKEIYQQYAESIEEFCSQVPDIFAIDSKEPFADLFFAFRAVIKVS